jgi:hypothetical protein
VFSQEWYLYTSEAHSFSILFPHKPQIQVKNIESDLGRIEQTTAYTLLKDSSGLEFQVIASTYPDQVFEDDDTDSLKMLIQSTLVDEMLTYLRGELIYKNESQLNGINCYWFLIKYNQHMALKNCIIWDHSHLITLMHYSEYERRLDIPSDRFFNSFLLFSKK